MPILRAPTPSDNTLPQTPHAAAEWLSGMGIGVIPIRAGTKIPSVKWEPFQTRLPTAQERGNWWSRGQRHGVAIVLGEVSGGLVARDFDDLAVYQDWCRQFPQYAAELPTVLTKRGAHVYCRASVTDLRTTFIQAGELKGNGGYVLAPPTLHPDGIRYVWKIPIRAVAELPILDPFAIGLVGNGRGTQRAQKSQDVPGGHRSLLAGAPHQTLKRTPEELLEVLGVAEAIAATQPTGPGQRNRQLFRLARKLKAMPELAGACADELEPIVRYWWERALPMIATKAWDESRWDFRNGWGQVRYAEGESPLDDAAERARDSPCPACASRYDMPAVKFLIGLCRELQRVQGGKPFFLGCRDAGRLIGASERTASRWLDNLVKDGLLALVEKGTDSTRRASSYRYVPPLDE